MLGSASAAGLVVGGLLLRWNVASLHWRPIFLVNVPVGLVAMAAGAWASYHYGPGIGTAQMTGPSVVAGFGFGLVVAPMADAILTGVPARNAGSASGLLSTTQQVGMALGVALVGVLFFTLLASGSGRGVDAVTPGLHSQLTAAGVPASRQESIVVRFRACVHDRSAATDPTKIPPSRHTRAPLPGQRSARQIPTWLVRQNAHNFARTFSITLWYAAGTLIVVSSGCSRFPAGSGPATWTPNCQSLRTITFANHDNGPGETLRGCPGPLASQVAATGPQVTQGT